MTCRTACETQDHASYGECCAAITILVGAGHERSKRWDNNLEAYRQARRQGVQPASTRRSDVDAAMALSRAVDAPFDATDGSFRV